MELYISNILNHPDPFQFLVSSLKEMGKVAPNKPSKRRHNENGTNSGSASTTREDETPPQTPAANLASSTDGENRDQPWLFQREQKGG